MTARDLTVKLGQIDTELREAERLGNTARAASLRHVDGRLAAWGGSGMNGVKDGAAG